MEKKKKSKLEIVGDIIDWGEIVYGIFRALFWLCRLTVKIFN